MPRWIWIVVAVVALYFAWQWMGKGGQRYGAIKISYDKIGQALDSLGVPFNSPGSNPGR